jgi:hypothetical protein
MFNRKVSIKRGIALIEDNRLQQKVIIPTKGMHAEIVVNNENEVGKNFLQLVIKFETLSSFLEIVFSQDPESVHNNNLFVNEEQGFESSDPESIFDHIAQLNFIS